MSTYILNRNAGAGDVIGKERWSSGRAYMKGKPIERRKKQMINQRKNLHDRSIPKAEAFSYFAFPVSRNDAWQAYEFGSERILRSLLRRKRANDERYCSLRIEDSPQLTADSFNTVFSAPPCQSSEEFRGQHTCFSVS
jgi:hypothetical protein